MSYLFKGMEVTNTFSEAFQWCERWGMTINDVNYWLMADIDSVVHKKYID